ncbi:MAG: TetR/AcrR family transcriptional regulator [Tannerellaceae bacterium]
MIKEEIVQTAFDLFSQYGIKSVSMDDIARNMSISKRTLYACFEDKEALLITGINFNYLQLLSFLEMLEKEPLSVLEVILLFYQEVMKNPRWYSRKFYDDLKRYPKALQSKEVCKEQFAKKCMFLFARGVKEEVFQPGVNFDILTVLVKEQAKMIHPSRAFLNHSAQEVYYTMLLTFLRGISTEKGQAILEKYTMKKTFMS